MTVKSVTDEQNEPTETSVRKNPAYYEVLTRYDDALLLFNSLSGEFETTHNREYYAVAGAFHAALEALAAAIDAHTARRVAVALLAAVQDKDKSENAFEQALTDFGVAYAQAMQAKDAKPEYWQSYEAALIVAEEKVKAEALRYARMEGKRHV